MKQLLPIFVLVATAAACGSPAPTDVTTGSGGGTAVIGLLSDVQNWNPYLVEDLDTEHVLSLVYPSLAVEQPDYRNGPPSFAPALARSWSWSDGGLELVVNLDPDARWSDGTPITARDVVFTWRVQTSEEIDWLYGDSKDSIDAVEEIDELTVRVRFNRSDPYLMMDLNDGLIIPSHAWSGIPFEAWPDTDWAPRVVAGGPFRLAAHTPQQEIVLERNPHYYRSGHPLLDRVVIRVLPSEQGLMNQLLAGDLDFLRSIPPSELDRVRRHDGLELAVFEDRSYTHVCWNTERPPLDDPAVRRALTEAIDRQTVIDVVYGGFGRLGVGPILTTFWAFDDSLEARPFSPAAARRALAAAGLADTDGDGILDRDGAPFTIELLAAAENQLRQDVALLVQTDLERVGVEVEPRFVEWSTLIAAVSKGEFDGLVNMWEEPTRIDLDGLWSSPIPGEPTFNFGRYSNPEVDRLLGEVGGLTDPAAQKPLFDRIQQLIVADQPYTFVLEHTRISAHSARLTGIEINAATPYFNIDEWSIETEPER
jgi:peptide/nickel transport system substrate-binding protein